MNGLENGQQHEQDGLDPALNAAKDDGETACEPGENVFTASLRRGGYFTRVQRSEEEMDAKLRVGL